jgi:ABC-type uncharacterized transport system substrate-binding protein
MKKFIFQSERDKDNNHDVTNVILTVESDNLEEIIEGFEDFLKANGFCFKGYLDFVGDEE